MLVGLLPTGQFLHPGPVLIACAAAVLFHMAAASGYLVNDILDVRRDQLHPRKRQRAIASGAISRSSAGVAAALLGGSGIVLAHIISPALAVLLGAYLAIALGYSLVFKHVVALDILVIALVFVMRAVAGVIAIEADISTLFLASVGFLALLLALGKRLSEAELLSTTNQVHRVVLRSYQAVAWRRVLVAIALATIACYALAATRSPTAATHPLLAITVAPVALGIWRYVWLVTRRGDGGEPERLLGRDRWMLCAAVGWVGMMAIAITR